MVRTRSAAAELVTAGHVRVNGERVKAPSRLVRIDDVITVALDRNVRLLQVAGFAERRGGAEAARIIYADLTPAVVPAADSGQPQSPQREAGAGRPTKRERRAIDRLQDDDS